MQKILISPIGGQVMHGIVGYLKKKSFITIGMDNNPESAGKFFVDEFLEVPNVSDIAYRDKVLEIIEKHKIDIFLSWLDPEIIFWNEKFYSLEIPSHLIDIFAFNFRKDLMRFYDKFKLYAMLDENGFRCPETSLLSQKAGAKDTGFPVILKPRIGFGAKDTYVAENEKTLNYLQSFLFSRFASLEKFIIQRYIGGIEYTVDFFAIAGKMVNAVVRERIKHKGVSLIGEVVFNDAVEKVVRDFCRIFNIDGLNNIQIMDHSSKLYILDFNPRPSGTIMLSVNAGVDLMNNLFEKMQKKEITEYGKAKRLKMFRYLCEFFYET